MLNFTSCLWLRLGLISLHGSGAVRHSRSAGKRRRRGSNRAAWIGRARAVRGSPGLERLNCALGGASRAASCAMQHLSSCSRHLCSLQPRRLWPRVWWHCERLQWALSTQTLVGGIEHAFFEARHILQCSARALWRDASFERAGTVPRYELGQRGVHSQHFKGRSSPCGGEALRSPLGGYYRATAWGQCRGPSR